MRMRQLIVASCLSVLLSSAALAIPRTWQGQSPPSWGFALNWTPIGVPQSGDDLSIGDSQNLDVESELDTDYTIGSLTLARGANVDTNGHQLTINDETTIRGDNAPTTSRLLVREHASGPATTSLEVEDVTLLVDSELILDGGRMVAAVPGTGHAEVRIVTTVSTFGGYGVLRFQDSLSMVTDQLTNNGVFETIRPPGAPATERYTLRIESADPGNARIDLDFAAPQTAIVNLASMTTLDIDTLFRSTTSGSAFRGTMNLAAGSIFDTTDSMVAENKYVIDAFGEVNVNASSANAGIPNTATFRGPELVLEAEAVLNINSGMLVLENAISTAATSTIDIGIDAGLQIDSGTISGDLNLNGKGISLIVNGPASILDPVFDWDGSEDSITTINADGNLVISADNIESGVGDNTFNGTINVDGGSIRPNIASGWTMGGTLNLLNNARYENSNSQVTIEGSLNVSGGTSLFFVESVFANGSSTNIQGTNDRLDIVAAARIEAGAQFSGNGVFWQRLESLTLADGANVQVPVQIGRPFSDGALHIEDGIGSATLISYDQVGHGQLFIELASTTQYDQLNVQNTAFIDGTLHVDLLQFFSSSVGDAFTILCAGGGVFGQFDNGPETLPTLGSSRKWFIDYGANEVTLRVLYSADIDNDGDVDGDDFLVIQRDDPSLIPQWQAQHGMSINLFSATQAVPEPTGFALLGCCVGLFVLRR